MELLFKTNNKLQIFQIECTLFIIFTFAADLVKCGVMKNICTLWNKNMALR